VARSIISPSPESTESRGRSAVAVLSERNFGPYFLGNLLSNCGTWFQTIAQALLIYRLTNSTFLVGLVSFAQFAGVILLVPWSGAAADRFDRKRLLIITQLVAVAISGVLALLAAANHDTVAVVIGLAFVLGFTTAFSAPAAQAIVPSLVPKEDLQAAVSMNSVTFNLARAIGPVLGTLVVTKLGVPWAFGLNSLSYLALVAALLVIHPAPQVQRARAKPSFAESIGIVRRDGRLIALLGVVASVSFALDPVNVLSPAYAKQVFHRPDSLVGFLIGAFGTGAVIAAFTASGKTATPYRRIGIMLTLLTCGTIAYALVPVLAFAIAALMIGGFGYLAGQTRANALLQTSVHDDQRGRVMALWSVCFLGARPVASLIDGAISSVAGIHIATLVMAVPTAVAAVTMFTMHRCGVPVGMREEGAYGDA